MRQKTVPEPRLPVSVRLAYAGDGTELHRVNVVCPFCQRTLPVEEYAIAPYAPRGGGELHDCRSVFLRPGGVTGTAGQIEIAALMTPDVVCVRDDLSIESLTALLLERNLHGAPVLDGSGALVGFVSMSDLVRWRFENADTDERMPPRAGAVDEALKSGFHAEELARATVREAMTPLAFSLPESAPVSMAAAVMAFEGVHRIAATSDAGDVVGILSALDVMRWLAQSDGYVPPPTKRSS